jgi:hypothetical protein
VVAAQARVDNLTGILAHLLDDDDATLATMQLARERLSVALALLESLLKTRAARTTQSRGQPERLSQRSPGLHRSTSGTNVRRRRPPG